MKVKISPPQKKFLRKLIKNHSQRNIFPNNVNFLKWMSNIKLKFLA